MEETVEMETEAGCEEEDGDGAMVETLEKEAEAGYEEDDRDGGLLWRRQWGWRSAVEETMGMEVCCEKAVMKTMEMEVRCGEDDGDGGDCYLRQWIIPMPVITFKTRTDEVECLILASDGLWDIMSNDKVGEVAHRILKWQRHSAIDNELLAAQTLVDSLNELAVARNSSDKISMIVADLKSKKKSNNIHDQKEHVDISIKNPNRWKACTKMTRKQDHS
ncbi:Protein phosphatase 2C [Cynara cardunculus var. scolymus]|uniref:Protein phosphatase 2C n=1 Tax=Cynara cardunculus var. scolymus TaxID=59895 RepID=A0A103XIP6_CYNCS|nr:Protein phosphatase 2C [Cynara cardunculus var. scolymus]